MTGVIAPQLQRSTSNRKAARLDDLARGCHRRRIVGAGRAAHHLVERCAQQERPLDLVLYEAGGRVGGVVETRTLMGEYRVELGADSFITNKPWAVNLCRRLGIEDRLIPTDARYRRSLVLRSGKPLPVPDGFQLLSPVDIGAVLRSSIFSWPGKLRMALEYLLPRGGSDADESLAHFVRRRFGNETLERLVQPLVGGIYTSDPEKLSLRATLPRFLEMERDYGSLIRALKRQKAAGCSDDPTASGARYGLFTTPAGGISELVEALSTQVTSAANLRVDTEVQRIVPHADGRGFILELSAGTHAHFDAVIVALPAFRAARLIEGFAARAAAALDSIEYASTAIVISGHKLADVRHPLNAFGLVVPAIEKRKILAVSFPSRKFPDRAPEGCVQLRTFVGGAMQPELLNQSDDVIKLLVQHELEEIFGVTWRPLISYFWPAGCARCRSYHVGHLDLVCAGIESELAGMPTLALAGNALYGVGIPDSIHSGEMAAERVFVL